MITGLVGLHTLVFSQLAQSPYTLIGIGDLNSKGLSHNMIMGGTGIAMPNLYNINNMNPALISMSRLTSFEVGFLGENRRVETPSLSQNSGGFSLGYLVFSFPIISGKWSTSVGLMPYSYVNYNVKDQQNVIDTEGQVGYSFRGKGGIDAIHWSNGFLLFKSLAVGAKITYHFGSIIDETVLQIIDETNTIGYNSALYERTKFSGLNYELGAAYRLKIKEENHFTLGVVYEQGTDIKSFRHERLERRNPNDEILQTDTILHNVQGTTFLPPRMGVGISYENDMNWMIGVDLSMQDWSLYEDFDGGSDFLTNSYRGSVGLEFVPDRMSITSYINRIIYRTGLSYEKTPYKVNDVHIDQFGINFGVSLPVSRASLLNLGLQYGQRGQKENGMIKESFIKFVVGISFNDIWFIRRPID